MRKPFYLFVFLFFLALDGFAQGNWGGGVDDDPHHFGFIFQYVSTEFKVIKKSSWREPYALEEGLFSDSLYSISAPVSPGFGFGFVSNLRMGNNADLRITPALIFADRLLDYEYKDRVRQQIVQTTVVDFPLGIKLKSDRRNNFRAYIIGGAKYSIDIVSKKKTEDSDKILIEQLLKNTKNNLCYEAGVGFDLYFEFFKMSPEIKLSNSFKSVLKRSEDPNHPYSAPIDKLFLRNLQFSLYFE